MKNFLDGRRLVYLSNDEYKSLHTTLSGFNPLCCNNYVLCSEEDLTFLIMKCSTVEVESDGATDILIGKCQHLFKPYLEQVETS